MSKFYVAKKVSLAFLGEGYKDAYLEFKTVPVSEYDELFKNASELTNIDATTKAMNTIKDKFLGGKFPDEKGALTDITVNDLDDFMDEETLNLCYLTILGQKPDPK